MDKFLNNLLEEKNKSNTLAVDEILGKIQKRAISVISLLSKVWLKVRECQEV